MKQNQTLSVMDAGRMTSLEIAEITGKPHNDVLKAIRKMEQVTMTCLRPSERWNKHG